MERQINLKRLHCWRLGQLWKTKQWKLHRIKKPIARPKIVFVKLENVASCLTSFLSKWMKKSSQTTKNALENISSEPSCTSIWFWFFLAFSSVVFRTKYPGCWAGNQIISSVGPHNRRGLSPAERGWTFENIISLELHCKDKTFAEKSSYIWFILLFCSASTNNCVIIWSNVSLTFCDGVVLCRVFTSLIIVIFRQEHFYLGSKVLFRLLPLSSLLEFTVFPILAWA